MGFITPRWAAATQLSVERARRAFGFEAQISLKEGLRRLSPGTKRTTREGEVAEAKLSLAALRGRHAIRKLASRVAGGRDHLIDKGSEPRTMVGFHAC